jgi:hypothetical protein
MSLLPLVSPFPGAGELESRIAQLRDEAFALADAARLCVPHELTTLHVSLQVVTNELGRAERTVHEAVAQTGAV